MKIVRGWIAAAILSLPSAIMAEGATDELRALLALLPAEATAGGAPRAEIAFGSRAGGEIASGPEAGPGWAVFRILPATFGAAYAVAEDDWPDLLGFSGEDVLSILTYSEAPREMTVISLSDDAAGRVPGVLLSQGYEAAQFAGRDVLLRGGDDYEISFGSLNRADPFGGQMGQASRIAVDGTTLYHAKARDDLAAMLGDAGDADRALISVLDVLDGLTADALVRAWIFPGLGEETGQGPKSRLLIADLSDGMTETGILLISTTDPETLAASLAARWGAVPSRGTSSTWEEMAGPANIAAHAEGVVSVTVSREIEDWNPLARKVSETLLMGVYRYDLIYPFEE